MSIEELHEDQREQQKESSGVFWLVILLGIFFLPAAIVGLLYAALLRYGRQRFSVIFSVAAVIDFFAILRLRSLGTFSYFWESLKDFQNLGNTYGMFIEPFLLVNLILGSLGGLIWVYWATRQMVAHPWKLKIPGTWMYQFKYRRTPIQTLKRAKKAQALRDGELSAPGKVPLGIDEESGKDNVVYRFDEEAIKHTLITGLPGSGKSISMMSMMKSDIEEGKSVVAIDFKRDPELASKLATWAKENGRKFYHFVNGQPDFYDIANSPGQSFYNPLASGTPTSKADMLLSMREYDTASAVYKAAMTQVLQVVFNMEHYVTLYDRRKNIPTIDWESGGFYTLVSIFTGNNLNELADQCVGTPIQNEAIALANAVSGRTQESHAADELRGQLRTITASEYGPWMRLNGTERNIDLFELTKQPGNVVLFSLNSDSEPEFAKYMGAIILSDLTSVSAKRRNENLRNQIHVYVDEFQIVNPDSIKGLLEKSRASSMGITLAQQSLEQIISSSTANGEAYLGSVLDTCGNFIVHFGATEPSAIRMAEILGKDKFAKYSATNKIESFFGKLNWKNRRNQRVITGEEEEWIYKPLNFMKLDTPSKENGFKSTAVVVNKMSMDKSFKGSSGAKARKVWMIPDKRVLESYYERDKTRTFKIPKESKPSLDDEIQELESKVEASERASSLSSAKRETSFAALSNPIVPPIEVPKSVESEASVKALDSQQPPLSKPLERASASSFGAPERGVSSEKPGSGFSKFGRSRARGGSESKASGSRPSMRRPNASAFKNISDGDIYPDERI